MTGDEAEEGDRGGEGGGNDIGSSKYRLTASYHGTINDDSDGRTT